MSELLSRKFIISFTVLVMAFVLVLSGKSEVKDFYTVASIVSGIYVSGNVASQFVNGKRN